MFLLLAVVAKAQITGEIYDTDGYPIPLASAIYKGHHVAEASDLDGKFKIARHNGWELTFSSVGFQPQTIKVGPNTPSHLKIVLKEDSRSLGEVVIKQKRERYSRKNNPAVELMKRVIAAKKRTHLDNYDYYQYNKYQKITFSLNDIKPADLDSGKFKNKAYVRDQIETSPYNGKLILPVTYDETVTQHIYRKNPRVEKDIIKGQRSEGVNNVLQTGEILNTMLREVFTDVDIYDDHMRLLQYQFTSPIGETAISFYRFYIQDTVYVDRVLNVESVERYGGLADRTCKLILQQTHVVVVDVHVGEHLAQHGVENLSRLQHVVHTFRALALDDVLLHTRVLSINVLCNGLVIRDRQDKLAVVGRCLNLVAYVSLVLELA